jgi:predicted dehydrogenase
MPRHQLCVALARGFPDLLASLVMNIQTKALTLVIAGLATAAAPAEPVKLITLDPGHFHAALVQKTMVAGVDPVVHVYAPAGPELDRHLAMIEGFNKRPENPTKWELKVHSGPDYLAEMLKDRPGNVVVISGNNAKKSRYILECVKAGLNVMADKPMAINPEGFALIEEAYKVAAEKKLVLLDIMTERHEISTMLQKEFSRFPAVFGELDKGTPDSPAVTKESVHHFSKLVNGVPLQRPPWFFDPKQQGEAIVDVTTHLADLVQWECFPGEIIKDGDVKVLSARSWNTPITLAEFTKTTKLDAWPDYLKPLVDKDGVLQTPANGEFTYTLRGVHAKVSVLWKFEAPAGAGDTHDSLLRGTKCSLHIRQGADQGYKPVLYIEPNSQQGAEWQAALQTALKKVAESYPGVTLKDLGGRYEVVIPDSYKVGHEAHFGQVSEIFLGYVQGKPVPAWEVPNTLVKYRTLMEAYRKSR